MNRSALMHVRVGIDIVDPIDETGFWQMVWDGILGGLVGGVVGAGGAVLGVWLETRRHEALSTAREVVAAVSDLAGHAAALQHVAVVVAQATVVGRRADEVRREQAGRLQHLLSPIINAHVRIDLNAADDETLDRADRVLKCAYQLVDVT